MRARVALGVVIVAVAGGAAVYLNGLETVRHEAAGASSGSAYAESSPYAEGGSVYARPAGSGNVRSHPSWADSVAVVVVVGGLALASLVLIPRRVL